MKFKQWMILEKFRIGTQYVFLFVLFGLVGCSSVETVREDLSTQDIFAAVFYEEGVRDWIAVESVTTGRASDGRVMVEAVFRNRREERADIQARVMFKYKQVNSLVEKTGWEPIHFDSGALGIYSAKSSEVDVARYTIEIRREMGDSY